MYRYIKIEDGFVTGVQESFKPVISDSLIESDTGNIGDSYNADNGEFTPTVEVLVSPLTVYEFRNRFTQAEKVAIYTAAETNIELKVWLDDLASASQVELDNAETAAGVNALVTAGILTQARSDEILS